MLRRRRAMVAAMGVGGGAAAPSLYDPISDFDFFIRPDAGVYEDTAKTIPATDDGDIVRNQEDQIGSVDATQTLGAGNVPTLQKAAGDLINGLPVIRYTGLEYYLVNGLAAAVSGTDKPFSLVAVIKRTTADRRDCIIGIGLSTSTSPILQVRTTDTANDGTPNRLRVQRRDDALTLKVTEGGVVGTSAVIISVACNGTVVQGYINGAQVITNGDLDVGATTLNQARIGMLEIQTTKTHFASGDFCDIYWKAGAISDAARQNAEEWLAARWNIALNP